MLIINADDFGLNEESTNNIHNCFLHGRISTTTAMVFMQDSERAAKIASANKYEVGLHVNFTELFTADNVNETEKYRQNKLVRFYSSNKYNRLLYNPFLSKDVKLCFKAQLEEFVRLYGKMPSHIDGHHHIHLCSNVIIDKIIPSHFTVRAGVSFEKSEKSTLNRLYRNIVNTLVKKRHLCVDKFYVMDSQLIRSGIQHIVEKSKTCNVELSSHPEMSDSYEFLMGDDFLRFIAPTTLGKYSDL
jgi:predicted glycoside hydrolase/deacetylase ChbG (UPF0249 family)